MAETKNVIQDEILEDEVQSSVSLLKKLREQTSAASKQVDALLSKLTKGRLNTSGGNSFLGLKVQMLLEYLINLTYTMMLKTRGESLKDDLVVDRLVEIRTVLEKMRPIDQKLKYQIDKLVQIATTGSLPEKDPLRFKPNPDNLASKIEDRDEGGEAGPSAAATERDGRPKKYVPPMLASAEYDGDLTRAEVTSRQRERAKKRALNSELMEELREEHDEGPEEVGGSRHLRRMKEDRQEKERREFEEANMIRLQTSRQDKKTSDRRMQAASAVEGITSFGDARGLSENWEDEEEQQRIGKKRKLGKKKGKKGGGGKKKKKKHFT